MAYIKQPLAERVCQQLRELILANRWRVTLPGIRLLCEEIQVSRHTMMLALRLLEKEGFLLLSSPGKPRAINQKMVSPAKPVAGNECHPVIAIITWRPETHLSQTDAEIYNLLNKSLATQDFIPRHIVFRDITRAGGSPQISHVIEQNPADVYVVMGAHAKCSKALKKLGVDVVYIGGAQVKGCTPRITYSQPDMCLTAMEHLTSIGHRRISVMLPGLENLATKTASPAERAIGRVFETLKLPFSTYNCPRWGKTKDEFFVALEKLFATTPPSALALSDASHLPRAVSFLMERGLKCPDDVSLVALDEADELQEYRPAISHIKKSNPALVKLVINSVRKKLTAQPDQEMIIVPTKLVVTGSIAKIPGKKKES